MSIYSNYTDQELTDLLKLGDGQAYDHIFRRFYPVLCFFARKFLPLSGMAEEVVQDVLFKIWQKRADFDSYTSIKAFLYISTKNACLDGIEQEQRKLKRDNSWYLQRSDFEPDVEERIIHAEVLMEVSQAIDLLPDQCRKIMKMSYEQGMSGKQIAEEMQLTVSTVNNQKARGISLLRKTLSVKGFSLLLVLLNHDLFS